MMYHLAYDHSTRGDKKYLEFQTIAQVESHINLTPENEYYYERIVTDTPKIYIDIDFAKTETTTKYKYMNESDFDVFINGLIMCISNKLDIDSNSSIIQTANVTRDGVKYISSCHLIFKDHSMHKKHQQLLMKWINTIHDYKIDDVVYKTNQLFRLVHMRKRGKQNRLNFYKQSFSFADCFLSNTATTTLKEFTTTSEMVEGIQTPPTIKDMLTFTNLTDAMTDAMTIIDFSTMPSDSWCLITKILLKLPYVYDISSWCKLSAVGTVHTYEDNIKFCNDWKQSGQVYNTWSGIPKLVKLLNECLPYTLKENYKLNLNELFKYIETLTTDINITNLKTAYTAQYTEILKLTPIQQKQKKLSFEGYQFKISSGFLKTPNTAINHNFYYQHLIYQNGYIKTDLEYDRVYSDISDSQIMDDIFQVLNLRKTTTKPKKMVIVQASYGIGKTHFILKNICKEAGDRLKMAMVTPNNTFNLEATAKLNQYGFQQWTSHTEKQDERNESDDIPNLICSLESIYKIEDAGDLDGLKKFLKSVARIIIGLLMILIIPIVPFVMITFYAFKNLGEFFEINMNRL